MLKDMLKFPETSSIASLQKEVNYLLEGFFKKIPFLGRGINLTVDVIETAEMITVNTEIPGIDPKDIDISITGNTLTITGEKKAEKEEKGKQYYRIERSYGNFARTVNIPSFVEAEKAKAQYNNGILTIIIPKSEKTKPKHVPIS